MSNDSPDPDRHARGWRLVSRDAQTEQVWIDAIDTNPPLLLVLDTQGDWWAVEPDCRHCAAPLANGLRKGEAGAGIDVLRCARCGVSHGPAVAGCKCVALMVVDEEIYAAPRTSAKGF